MDGNATSSNALLVAEHFASPYAYLPLDVVPKVMASQYICIATLAVGKFWDWLLNLSGDVTMTRYARLRPPLIFYYIARYARRLYCLEDVTKRGRSGSRLWPILLAMRLFRFIVAPMYNCNVLQKAIATLYALGGPGTAALFYFRIRAVYSGRKWVQVLFGVMWLFVFGGCLMIPFAESGKRIGPTDFCITSSVKHFGSVGVIANTVYDTLVFIAISWFLVFGDRGRENKWKAFFFGKGLYRITKTLVQGGQLYYLTTVTLMVATLIALLSDSKLPAPFHSMLTVPNVALANALASRVFRDVWLDAFDPPPGVNDSLTWRAASAPDGASGSSTMKGWSSTNGSHLSSTKGWQGTAMDEDMYISRGGDTYPLRHVSAADRMRALRIPKLSAKDTFV